MTSRTRARLLRTNLPSGPSLVRFLRDMLGYARFHNWLATQTLELKFPEGISMFSMQEQVRGPLVPRLREAAAQTDPPL